MKWLASLILWFLPYLFCSHDSAAALKGLGDDSFKVREASQQILEKRHDLWAADIASRSKDPEVRARGERLRINILSLPNWKQEEEYPSIRNLQGRVDYYEVHFYGCLRFRTWGPWSGYAWKNDGVVFLVDCLMDLVGGPYKKEGYTHGCYDKSEHTASSFLAELLIRSGSSPESVSKLFHRWQERKPEVIIHAVACSPEEETEP
jgi:hypothetical protein